MSAATRQVVGGLTNKQSAFVEALLSGLEPVDAYLRAYRPPTMTRRSASYRARDLLRHAGVQAAMAEARAAVRERRVITIETVTGILLDAVEVAQQREQAAPMVAAATALAKVHGLIRDNGPDEAPERTSEELLVELRRVAAELGMTFPENPRFVS